MNCFLIDFENVKSTGLKGIEHLIESDDVYIFYSEYANTITFDVHHKINKSHANLKFFKSGIVAKNALDFQLISYLGYLIAQKKYKNYFVITGDRGFESAVSFWKDFFKQNKFNDLSINRFYNIQDALDKKSIPSKFYNKKLPPTIPTVETEIELRQLKATNVIVDKPSNDLENNLNKDLNIKDVDTKPLKTSTSDTVATSNEVKTVHQEQKEQTSSTSTNTNDTQKSSNRQPVQQQRQATPLLEEKAKSSVDKQATNGNAKNSNNNVNKKSSNNVGNKNQVEKSKDDKDKSKNKNNQVKNNNKKAFNNSSQQQKKNSDSNKNTNNNNRKAQNSTTKISKNTQNDTNNKKVKNSNNTLNVNNNKNTSAEKVAKIDTKSKGFVFGKVDLNDNTSIMENIQKKSPVALIEQTSKDKDNKDNTSKKEPIIKTIDLVENIAPKKEVSKEKVTVPTETISEIKSKEVEPVSNVETSTSKDKEVPTDTSKTKRKVGRPRVKSTTDKKEKPKNNKKFQEDIPNDKLNKMLDKISNISEFADYSKDDKVKICKIVAFSNSKQEGYQAFMSCFGKRKGVEIYKIVKQEFDALKNLYLNS